MGPHSIALLSDLVMFDFKQCRFYVSAYCLCYSDPLNTFWWRIATNYRLMG